MVQQNNVNVTPSTERHASGGFTHKDKSNKAKPLGRFGAGRGRGTETGPTGELCYVSSKRASLHCPVAQRRRLTRRRYDAQLATVPRERVSLPLDCKKEQ